MSTEANKAIVRRYFEEVYNQGNDALIHDLFASDFNDSSEPDHHGVRGPLLAKHIVDFERRVFPDIHFAIENLLAEEDKVVVHLTISGTHQGDFRGVPPSGRYMSFAAVECLRVMDGKIAQVVWHVYDKLSMLQQMGAIPETRKS
jgi:steroid delta-isomerase-like uncharacterized protein